MLEGGNRGRNYFGRCIGKAFWQAGKEAVPAKKREGQAGCCKGSARILHKEAQTGLTINLKVPLYVL